ncbi:GBS Bsp-like repeat-containing protein [[Clostridium] spiroforme]|nr:GBS Bsp-like repeat-containing protein [Thomasclavelia spiroformis]
MTYVALEPVKVPEEKIEISNVQVTNVTRKGYTISCIISSNNDITKVEMPTWTENDWQDDIIWHNASFKQQSDGTYVAKCNIYTADHNDEAGTYITHIYAYTDDKKEIYVKEGIEIPSNILPEITDVKVSNITADGYTVTCKVNDDGEVDKVLMPTWTKKNDQDDLVWHKAEDLGNGMFSFTVNKRDHNFEYGTYITHIYAYDNDNNCSQYYLEEIEIKKENKAIDIYNVYISDANDDGYTVTCEVESLRPIDRVLMPTWTEKNGQDDIIWHEAKAINDNTYSFRVLRSDHNFEFGTYSTHIYAYDIDGNSYFICLNYHNIINTTVSKGWTYIGGNKYFFDNKGNLVGNMPAKKVIDVSLYNGTIDWETVSKYGEIDGAILRIVAHPNGSYIEDEQFANNLNGCRKYNIPFGIYIYDYSNNVSEAYNEAQLVYSILKKYNITNNELSYPIYFDMERKVLSTAQFSANARTFIDTMSSYGFNADVYSYRSLLNNELNDPYIWSQTSWMAAYTDEIGWSNPYYHGKFGWQYTSGGTIPGIQGYVDISCWYEI